MGNYVATYYGDLVIDKKFISGPLYTVLDEQGKAVAAQYTVHVHGGWLSLGLRYQYRIE